MGHETNLWTRLVTTKTLARCGMHAKFELLLMHPYKRRPNSRQSISTTNGRWAGYADPRMVIAEQVPRE